MKRTVSILLLSFLALPLLVCGQDAEKIRWRKTEDHWVKKNSISVTASVMGMTNYYGNGSPQIQVEYDRALPYNLSVSAMALYAPCDHRSLLHAYAFKEIFCFAGAKVNYNLPVIRNWLYFRVGVGGGVGYHKVLDIFTEECRYNDCDEDPQHKPYVRDKVGGHFVVDMYWVFRATKRLELRFSPLIVTPSHIFLGGRFNEPYNDRSYFYFNAFGTLGVGVRF